MKRTFIVAALVGVSLCSLADATQTVTISGETIAKDVASLSFDGDNVVIAYSDGDSQTVDMDLLAIALTYPDESGISAIESDEQVTNPKVYNLAGQYVGNDTKSLSKGIYIVNGKKIVVR